MARPMARAAAKSTLMRGFFSVSRSPAGSSAGSAFVSSILAQPKSILLSCSRRLLAGDPAAPPPFLHLMHELIESRQRQQGEEGRGDQSTHHDDRQRPFDLRAVETQHEQRQQAQDGATG